MMDGFDFSVKSYTQAQIISYESTDGLKLKGYLAISPENRATIVHIHGSCGNFYENDFIPSMAREYTSAGLNFLSVNNRGHDCIAEAYQKGRVVYVGGCNEVIEECVYDIEGAVQFASKLGAQVILQGHSLGCLKVLMYLVQASRKLNFILLSPSDSYQLQANYISPETVEQQVKRIQNSYTDQLDAILPSSEFGIRQKDVEYYIPISPRTLISLFGDEKTRLLAYKQSPLYSVQSHAFIYYGGADRLQTESPEVIHSFFEHKTKSLRLLVCDEGDHHFRGFETFIAKKISEWAAAL